MFWFYFRRLFDLKWASSKNAVLYLIISRTNSLDFVINLQAIKMHYWNFATHLLESIFLQK